MGKVLLYSLLLIAGLAGSQVLSDRMRMPVAILTMTALSFIMIHVGYEFELDKRKPGLYAWDYVVAAIAATLPWMLCSMYFVIAMSATMKSALLQGLFAAPTSAGVLFSMLAAAGLGASWLFNKARVLAIFDDLHTLLLLIPLKIILTGPHVELWVVAGIMVVMLGCCWRFFHQAKLPISWPFVLAYAITITFICIALRRGLGVHLEVLLPAFTLGCVLARPAGADPHSDDAREGHEEGPESAIEQHVSSVVSACFMVLVGLSMPAIFNGTSAVRGKWGIILLHVLAVTVLSNIGKLFPALCFRKEATLRERIALAVGMFPRGEVGAGVLVISLSYGFGGDTLTVAVLSLALNLLCTGPFILVVKQLLMERRAAGVV